MRRPNLRSVAAPELRREVLKRAEQTSAKYSDLIDEANAATDNAQVIAEEAVAARAAALASVEKRAD